MRNKVSHYKELSIEENNKFMNENKIAHKIKEIITSIIKKKDGPIIIIFFIIIIYFNIEYSFG